MQILSRTSKSQIRERGVYGQTVLDLHQQLSLILARRSGREVFGALLAEPISNRTTSEIVWRTRLSGEVKPWAQLNAAEQAAARASIEEAAAAVLAIAREYRTSDDKARSADADAFFAALGYDPAFGTCQIDYDKVFTVGGVPVVTEWGCDRADGVRSPVTLSSVVAAPPTPPAPAAVPTPDTPTQAPGPEASESTTRETQPGWWRWIWSLIVLTVLLALLSLLVRGCTPIGFGPPMPKLGGLIPDIKLAIPELSLNLERDLRGEIAELGRQLDERALSCEAPANEEEARLRREGASAGLVNVSLRWNNFNDLDLVVIDPKGEKIFFENRKAGSGGTLDVDMNAGPERSREPIENIRWDNTPPSGRYQVKVLLYQINETGATAPTDFTVTVTIVDQKTEHPGQLTNRQLSREILVTEFEVP